MRAAQFCLGPLLLSTTTRRGRTPVCAGQDNPSQIMETRAFARPHVLMSTFAELGLPTTLVDALAAQGVTEPFPIQAATLPHTLAGRDVLGRGRTGSGKTYAFALPVLARLAAGGPTRRPGRPRALILAPTRELATQINQTIAPLAAALSLRTLTVFG